MNLHIDCTPDLTFTADGDGDWLYTSSKSIVLPRKTFKKVTPKGPDQASIYDEFESDNVLTLYTHALIIFEGAREGAGGLSCDTEI